MAVVVAHHRVEEQQPHQIAKDGVPLLREGLCDGTLYELEREKVAREIGLLDALDKCLVFEITGKDFSPPPAGVVLHPTAWQLDILFKLRHYIVSKKC